MCQLWTQFVCRSHLPPTLRLDGSETINSWWWGERKAREKWVGHRRRLSSTLFGTSSTLKWTTSSQPSHFSKLPLFPPLVSFSLLACCAQSRSPFASFRILKFLLCRQKMIHMQYLCSTASWMSGNFRQVNLKNSGLVSNTFPRFVWKETEAEESQVFGCTKLLLLL